MSFIEDTLRVYLKLLCSKTNLLIRVLVKVDNYTTENSTLIMAYCSLKLMTFTLMNRKIFLAI